MDILLKNTEFYLGNGHKLKIFTKNYCEIVKNTAIYSEKLIQHLI